jgi:hypothetical protein
MHVLITVVTLVSISAFARPQKVAKSLPVKKVEVAKTEVTKQVKELEKKAADCDEKAKKAVEITETSISLGKNTGCSLDEAKP